MKEAVAGKIATGAWNIVAVTRFAPSLVNKYFFAYSPFGEK